MRWYCSELKISPLWVSEMGGFQTREMLARSLTVPDLPLSARCQTRPLSRFTRSTPSSDSTKSSAVNNGRIGVTHPPTPSNLKAAILVICDRSWSRDAQSMVRKGWAHRSSVCWRRLFVFMTIILSTDKQPSNQLKQQWMMKTNSFDLTSNGGQRLDEGSELQRPQVTGSLNSVLMFPNVSHRTRLSFFPKSFWDWPVYACASIPSRLPTEFFNRGRSLLCMREEMFYTQGRNWYLTVQMEKTPEKCLTVRFRDWMLRGVVPPLMLHTVSLSSLSHTPIILFPVNMFYRCHQYL